LLTVAATAAAFLLCVFALSEQADAKRVALVIGNAAYRSVSPLANPLNDARLVAKALAASGFDVQLGADLDRKGMEAALQEFAHDAMQADVAMVYFAGHGLEASGANWLLPVDVNIRSFADIPATAVPFETVARSLAGASVKIVALDACRDNPFAARLPSASGAVNRGLAEVELDGYVVIYAAAAGQFALDGSVNSPFAQTLARWIGEKTVDLRLLAGKIRDDVIATTGGAQRPFVSASLPGKVTTLAPATEGKVRSAASVPNRRPYYFDYVRSLRDSACIQTRTVKCQTESMLEAAARIVTIDDDGKLRIWDTASEAAPRAESLPRGLSRPDVAFVASASALAVAHHSSITMVPLSGGARETRTIEHYDNPIFLFAAGAPAIAVYAYAGRCGLGFVDLSSLTLAGKMPWEPNPCFKGEVAWSVPGPASDRFVAQVTTLNRGTLDRTMFSKVNELLLASYHSREVVCRVGGAANDAAFGADGDLYTAHDDGTIVRHDRSCRPKQTYRLHQGAVEQILAMAGGRMLSRSVDGAVKLWSPEATLPEKELTGLARQAQILDAAEDGSAVLILNEDRRLYIWYGEPRLGPYIGPSGPVCAGALSSDSNAVYALKCEGNVELWRRQRLN
jgi:Caspase domain